MQCVKYIEAKAHRYCDHVSLVRICLATSIPVSMLDFKGSVIRSVLYLLWEDLTANMTIKKSSKSLSQKFHVVVTGRARNALK